MCCVQLFESGVGVMYIPALRFYSRMVSSLFHSQEGVWVTEEIEKKWNRFREKGHYSCFTTCISLLNTNDLFVSETSSQIIKTECRFI